MHTNAIKWAKFAKMNSLQLLPRDVIMIGKGCCLSFIDLSSLNTKIYSANNYKNGEGVQCFTAHKSLSIFAFGELCVNPRIFVNHYPSFEKVSVLADECVEGYSALTFSEGDVLVSLGNFPFFTLIVWNWRKGENLAKVLTGLDATNQMIRCSPTNPLTISQMAIGTTRLILWTFGSSGKKNILKKKEVMTTRKTIAFSQLSWNPDGTLFILDVVGNVYTVNYDYFTLQMLIKWPNVRGSHLTSFTRYKGGLLVSGSDGKIIHFKKQTYWENCGNMKSPEPMKSLRSNNKDVLVSVSFARRLYFYDQEREAFKPINLEECNFTNFCLIFPVGDIVITLSDKRMISVWEVSSGKLRSTFKLDFNALDIVENPVYPYVGIAFENGIFQMLSVYNPDKLFPLTSVHLTRKPLNKIRFVKNGKMMIVGNTFTGEIFILEGYPGIKITVEAFIDVLNPICDFILIPSRTCLRVFVLLVTSVNYKAGNRFIRYCIIKGNKQPNIKEFQLQESMWYKYLYPTDRENRDRVFYALPFGKKILHELETKRGDRMIRIIKTINLGHQMNVIKLNFYNEYMISYGYDGLVIVRTTEGQNPFCVLMPHHRKNAGIRKAYITPMLNCILSLGRDKVLCQTAIDVIKFDEQKYQELKQKLLLPKLILMFEKSIFTFLPIEYPGKTWLEAEALRKVAEEEKICLEERNAILEEFKLIQEEVCELLYKNLNGPDNEKIDINYFDMNEELTVYKSRECDELSKKTHDELELQIEAQDKVSKWMKANYWDKMSIKGKAIWGIFCQTVIENYPLLPEDTELNFFVECIEEYRKIEQSIATGQFLPWIPKPKSEIEEMFSTNPYIKDEKDTFLEALKEEEEEERIEEDLETVTAFAGSITHHFIQKNPSHYDQEQIHSYIQIEYETLLSLYENERLKKFFNSQFEGIMSQKEREMKLISDRNERLRHILSELNFFNINKWGLERLTIVPTNPEWHPTEQPERIITVTDREVPITPYVSPSEQAFLDAKAAEEERIRLALLADDFRERALMKMMNGVLEMTWEDEIKFDITKPKCLVEKDPEDWNEEEIRAVRDYEEKTKQLNADREYYKLLLETEYGKLCNTLREGIRRFNGKVDDFLLLKIRIECAILQERLKTDMIRDRSLRKILLNGEETEVLKQIHENEKEIDDMLSTFPHIYEALNELKGESENFVIKDKQLEKNFKRDFQTASPVVTEIAVKQLKRRPKTNIRNLSSTAVAELAKCVLTKKQTVLLNLSPDSIDFMKSLDAIDMYVGLPVAVDEAVYAKICQHRRFKIESELRARVHAIDVADSENTLNNFRKILDQKREHSRRLRNDLDKVRQQRLDTVHDNDIILVLKQGIVELQLTGSRKDFENAILMQRSEIEFVNKIIKRNGRRKIRAMEQNMAHHKAILMMEWEHSRLRMTVADFEEHLTDIKGVNVTKDMQSYLKAMARGYTPEGSQSFEEELERLTQSYERMLNERKELVEKAQKKINSLNIENKRLDEEICGVNIDICEYQFSKDNTLEKREQEIIRVRMASLTKRARLVKLLQEYHNQILVLQTELELLRLKTYPTLKYKILP